MSLAPNVIYFPYIRVPQDAWFTNILLYWDKVYSIVPTEYTAYTPRLGSYNRSLIEEHLIEPITPMEYLQKIPDFSKNFLSFVDNANFPVLQKKARIFSESYTRIHIEKMRPIEEGLVSRGLARADNYPWYCVEKNTANQFMLYLATELGKLKAINSQPVTDNLIDVASFQVLQKNKLENTISEIRPVILNKILPSPRKNIDPRDIHCFKEDNKDFLSNFRKDIEANLLFFASIDDGKRNDAIIHFIRQKETEIEELRKLMTSRGWKVKLSKVAGYSLSGFGIYHLLSQHDFIGAISVIGGLAPNIVEEITEDSINCHPMAYAVVAEKTLL